MELGSRSSQNEGKEEKMMKVEVEFSLVKVKMKCVVPPPPPSFFLVRKNRYLAVTTETEVKQKAHIQK